MYMKLPILVQIHCQFGLTVVEFKVPTSNYIHPLYVNVINYTWLHLNTYLANLS